MENVKRMTLYCQTIRTMNLIWIPNRINICALEIQQQNGMVITVKFCMCIMYHKDYRRNIKQKKNRENHMCLCFIFPCYVSNFISPLHMFFLSNFIICYCSDIDDTFIFGFLFIFFHCVC